uniref:Lipase TDL2 n=1 Tax=Talaromyces thermophilus TaxID=28565 RepID=A0A7G8YWW3_TALTH|nr:lipase TDL2 [Thermomyces dupontii]
MRSSLVLFFISAWTALARPVRREVSQDLLDLFNLFAQYSAAAYCAENNDAPVGSNVTCSENVCPKVEEADATFLYSFEDSGLGDVTGLLALDNTNKLIVLAFRGSRSIENWIGNLIVGLRDIDDICSGCEGHTGFVASWKSVANTLRGQVENAVKEHPDYRVVFTGHSLGGALATIAGAALRGNGYNIDVFSYGAPRVGNRAFAEFLTAQTGGTLYRITHTNDIVPRLPPRDWGYSHSSPEYWITSGNDAPVTANDIVKVEGIDSTDGNNQPNIPDIPSHLWYFGAIAECD